MLLYESLVYMYYVIMMMALTKLVHNGIYLDTNSLITNNLMIII